MLLGEKSDTGVDDIGVEMDFINHKRIDRFCMIKVTIKRVKMSPRHPLEEDILSTRN